MRLRASFERRRLEATAQPPASVRAGACRGQIPESDPLHAHLTGATKSAGTTKVVYLLEAKELDSRPWEPWTTLSAPNPHRLPSEIVRDDEHLLVAAAKAGDNAAFEELVNRYEGKIFGLTMSITSNRADAEDATQEAFLKSYSHLGTFQGDSRFYTWLVRIAANEALMRLRKRRPGEFSLDEPIAGEEDLMPRDLEEWRPNPEQQYAQTEIDGFINEAIEKLEPDFRIVLMLRDVEEMSTEETAEALGMSIPAVKSRLLRARLKLRQRLNRHFRMGEPN